MGGGGGKSSTQSGGTSTQVSKVELPPWVDKAGHWEATPGLRLDRI